MSGTCVSSSIICVSRFRKPASPSISKIVGMLTPVRATISWSQSAKRSLRRRASSLPTVVLPAPIMPISIRQLTRDSPEIQMKKGAGTLSECPPAGLYQQMRRTQRSVSASETMRGVMKTRSSLRFDTRLCDLKRWPSTGTSPSSGTLSSPVDSSSS